MTRILWLARKPTPEILLYGLRPVGKIVPPPMLWALLRPTVAAVTLLELVYTGPTFADFGRLPASMRPPGRRGAGWLGLWRQRTGLNLAKLAVYWADGLGTPRWARICRVVGPSPSRDLLGAGTRPVVLVTLHFGPYEMLFYGLRARGVPIATLAADGESQCPWHRRRLRETCDRAAGLMGVPRRFSPGQLREVADFLRADRVLLVFASGGTGRPLEVGDRDLSLPLGPGALRLAALLDAALIPCVIVADPRGAMSLVLGEPLPPVTLLDRRRDRETCGQLLRFWAPPLRASPGQSDSWLIRILRPRAATEEIPAVAGSPQFREAGLSPSSEVPSAVDPARP
jgi:hypothetical protein